MNYDQISRVVTDFLNEYDLHEPGYVSIHPDETYPSAAVLVDGVTGRGDDISSDLLWETFDNGITAAKIVFNGVDIRVQIYDREGVKEWVA